MTKSKFKTNSFRLEPGQPAAIVTAFGNFVYVETAAHPFEISFDGTDFIPAREGRMIQVSDEFDTLFMRASGSSVSVQITTGNGGITHFANYGGGGSSIGSTPVALLPFSSYVELANTLTEGISTGAYIILITGAPPSSKIFQLRAVSGADPVNDPDGGIIVPADYSATNKRAWYQA